MKQYKLLTISILCLFNLSILYSQSAPKKVVVEHFTNTRCSVCASRNPGFYNALDQKQNVLHIAYHPSSPYSNCLFSTQNKAENDARTKYYDLFGGTPTFTINGVERSSSAVQSSSVYAPFENQTSPISVDIGISPSGSDSIGVFVEIKAVAAHSLGNLLLYIPMIEDTVFYNAPNGEKQHYDVFRKSFTGPNSISFIAPVFGGSSYIYTSKVAKNQLWNLKRLSAITIISGPDKTVIQSEQSDLYSDVVSSVSNENIKSDLRLTLFPNPTLGSLIVSVDMSLIGKSYSIYNLQGSILKTDVIYLKETDIDVSYLPTGHYILNVSNGVNFVSKFFTKTY